MLQEALRPRRWKTRPISVILCPELWEKTTKKIRNWWAVNPSTQPVLSWPECAQDHASPALSAAGKLRSQWNILV